MEITVFVLSRAHFFCIIMSIYFFPYYYEHNFGIFLYCYEYNVSIFLYYYEHNFGIFSVLFMSIILVFSPVLSQ